VRENGQGLKVGHVGRRLVSCYDVVAMILVLYSPLRKLPFIFKTWLFLQRMFPALS